VFEVISSLNFADPAELTEAAQKIELRGYDSRTHLTGQYALKLSENQIRPLSVSDISDYLCPTRRDLYFKKGKNRPAKIRRTKTWGGVAGNVVEGYFIDLFKQEIGRRNRLSYEAIKKAARATNSRFREKERSKFRELDGLKAKPSEDPDWLLNLLYLAGKMSMGSRSLDRILAKNSASALVKETDVQTTPINPNVMQIGISKGAKPDFILPSQKIVGDIKSGMIGFKEYFFNTCTGYALAYENALGIEHNIDIGVIFFFPTRCSDFAKPISFAQTYIFVIDDELRGQFKRRRNEAYSIISNENPPEMPSDTKECIRCQFREVCLDGV